MSRSEWKRGDILRRTDEWEKANPPDRVGAKASPLNKFVVVTKIDDAGIHAIPFVCDPMWTDDSPVLQPMAWEKVGEVDGAV